MVHAERGNVWDAGWHWYLVPQRKVVVNVPFVNYVLALVRIMLCGDHLYLEKAREAFVPPNPKLFDIDTSTVFFCADRGT